MTSGGPARRRGDVGGSTARVGTFDGACDMVVAYLSVAAPMGLWAVTRVANGMQLMLTVDSPGYGVEVGTELPFETSLCRPMTTGQAPRAAPDVSLTPGYTTAAAASAAAGLRVRSYIGMPILRPNGELFGTICGFSPDPGSQTSMRDLEPLLMVFSELLSAVLEADTLATTAAREAERYRRDSDTDVLTGLRNRRGWDRFLAVEEPRFRRFGEPACVVVIDLDQLKTTNDTAGHHAGDQLLRGTAHVLRHLTRELDFVARLGGDEFGLVVPGVGSREAVALVRRLEQALNAAGIAASVGSAPFTVTSGLAGAWKEADRAMYRRKQHRRSESAG